MENLQRAWTALQLGGAIIYPLLFLALLALVLLLDRAFVFWRYTRLPATVPTLLETDRFAWPELERQLSLLGPHHYFRRFFGVIVENRKRPIWWLESRAAEEAQLIEKALNRGLWMLETIVTAAPLLGLLGTITGMMAAFSIISGSGLVEPAGITGGVAQALIATAVGIFIALIALFGFNFLSRLQAQTLDEMERLGTRLIDQIRLDQQEEEAIDETA